MSEEGNSLLPKSVEIGGVEYKIRSDYRVILDICITLNDADYDAYERAIAMLVAFYPDVEDIPQEQYEEAIKQCVRFIGCGEQEDDCSKNSPKLVDWEQDFKYIVAPINRVSGMEIRDISYMHWWTFIGYFYEIGGDCLFAQIVRIREKLAKGKPLDKDDRKWYQENRRLVDMKNTYSTAETELLKSLGIKK